MTGEERDLEVQGLFYGIGHTPNTQAFGRTGAWMEGRWVGGGWNEAVAVGTVAHTSNVDRKPLQEVAVPEARSPADGRWRPIDILFHLPT